MDAQIQIPKIRLRPYQLAAWEALEAGVNRAALVWPRRGGKDTVSLHWAAYDAHRKIGNYWHLFPEQKQARKAIWNGINKQGQRIIDSVFPRDVIESTKDDEMLIKLKCGSTWQLGGADRYDALVGANPRGVVFSEFAICNPASYAFVRPILAENGGWALFPFTPRGRNHGYELFNKLSKDDNSFAQLLTCDDTGHMPAAALEIEKEENTEEFYLQEYYCSWDFGIEGSIYARQMNKAMTEGRVCSVPYDQGLPVWTGWDVGLHDSTTIWFMQEDRGGQPRLIDYYERNGEQLKHYVDLLKSKPYTYGMHFLPHDAGHTRLGMPESIEQQINGLGITNTQVLQQERNIWPAIDMCRNFLGKAVLDDENTSQGRAALSTYRKEFDEVHKVFKMRPLHDWASHGSDALRSLVRAYEMGLCNVTWGGQLDYSAANRAVI